MTMILFLPAPNPPRERREIKKDGVLYREVFEEDDETWLKTILTWVGIFGGFVALFVGGAAFMFWVLFPIFGWLMRHAPFGTGV